MRCISRTIESLFRDIDLEYREKNLMLLEKNRSAILLDCGCNDGEFTHRVSGKIETTCVFGIEVVPILMEHARARGIDVRKGNLNEKLPFEEGFFDVVHANQVIEHLSDTDTFVKEVYRVLKPGGYLIISTPNLASMHNIFYLLAGKQPYWAQVSDEVFVGTFHPTHRTKHVRISQEPEPAHRRLFTIAALKELLEYYNFHVEKTRVSGYYPLPAMLAKAACVLDKKHAAIISMKARKA